MVPCCAGLPADACSCRGVFILYFSAGTCFGNIRIRSTKGSRRKKSDGKLLGDGVNLASRIQSLGQGNTILFSEEIRDKIKNSAKFKIVSLGLFDFKNVEKRIEVFALANEGLHVPSRQTIGGKVKKKKNWLNFLFGEK